MTKPLMRHIGAGRWRCSRIGCRWEIHTPSWDRTDTEIAESHARWHDDRDRLQGALRRTALAAAGAGTLCFAVITAGGMLAEVMP